MEEIPTEEGRRMKSWAKIGSKEDLEMQLEKIEEEVRKYTAELEKEKEEQEQRTKKIKKKESKENIGG